MGVFSKPTLDVRSQAGFTILYEKYGDFVYHSCYRYLQDKDVSHNLTADIFTSIWERRDVLARETWKKDSWKLYLSQAAKQQVYNHLRVKRQLEIYFARTSHQLKSLVNSTEETFEFDELANQIDTLLNGLPPKCQEVFRLSREKGQSNKEIAESLKISVNSVKTHIAKAVKYLRENLSDYNVPKRSTGS
ncbi:MAG: RNA polymerase sigma-70 factor [Bacteroidota bacterium]